MENSRFPNKLKTYRRGSGFSQKKVARLLGLADTSTLSRWEHGMALPSMVQVFRLSRIYNTHPHLLYEELWREPSKEFDLLAHTGEPFNTNQSFFI